MSRYLRRWPIFALVLGMGGAGFTYTVYRTKKEKKEAVRELRIERGDLATTISSTGTVSPENRLEIKPPIAGRVERVLVQEGERVRKGQMLAWMSSTERAALLDAAHAEGEAEVKRWEQLYRPTPVIAPISGMVIARNVEAGQTFTATDSILTMSDRLTVKAQVDETDLAQIQLGQAAEISLDAYPGEKIAAKVDQIAFDAKTVNNVTTYVVDVLPLKTPKSMRSGMTANVTFFTEGRKNVVLLPNEALKVADGATTVLTRGPQGESSAREVKLGLSDGRVTEVMAGLEAGDVILLPVYTAKEKKAGGANPFAPMGPRPPGARGSARR